MSLKNLKRFLFQKIRRQFLFKKIFSIQNYLKTTEITRGLSKLEGKRILVLAPHPDDESIGCGGTIRLLADQKSHVDVLFLTEGENSGGMDTADLVKKRRLEATTACALLGVENVSFLNGKDGDLYLQQELSAELAEQLKIHCYDAVFSPWVFDGHSDHVATYQILQKALKSSRENIQVWMYEVWSPLFANHVVPIDKVIETKMKAIQSHSSQVSIIDYPRKFRALAEHRSLLCPENQYAEAFFVTDRDFLLSMAPAA